MSTFARVEQDDIFDDSSQFSGRLINHPDITFRFMHRHFPVVSYYWREHIALIISVICIGGMAGLTKLLFPLIGHMVYGRKPSDILDFVVAFGVAKAICSALIGVAADECGRTNLLRIGWVFGLPVFLIIMFADAWEYVVMANWLMGVQQGICWSVTIFMMVDLASMKNKAIVIALNEFVGFFVVSVVTILSSFQKSNTSSIHDFDSAFWGGLSLAIVGTAISLILPETHHADHSAILQRYYRMFSLELQAELHETSETELSDFSHTDRGHSELDRETLAVLSYNASGTRPASSPVAAPGSGAVSPISSVDPRMGAFAGDPAYNRAPSAGSPTAFVPVTGNANIGGNDATDMNPPLASEVEEGLHTLHNEIITEGIAYRARRPFNSVGPFPHEEPLSSISIFDPAPPPPMRNFAYPLFVLWDTVKASGSLTVGSWASFATCFTGFVSAAKDGLMWGLAPLFYKSFNLKVEQVGLLIAAYFFALALLQVFAGFLADRGHTKAVLLSGLLLEAFAVTYVAWSPRAVLLEAPAHRAFPLFMIGSLMMGIGQACIIPTLHHSMIQPVPAEKHSTALGVLRMWRGFGTAFGAGVGGVLQNEYGYVVTFTIAGCLMFLSVILVSICVDETRSHLHPMLLSPQPSPTATQCDTEPVDEVDDKAEEETENVDNGVTGRAAEGEQGDVMEIQSNIDQMEPMTPY